MGKIDENKNMSGSIFYPNDVDGIVEGKENSILSSAISFGISTFLLGNAIMYFVIFNVVKNFGGGIFMSIVALVLMNIFVLIPLIRIKILKEDRIEKEFSSYENDSFGRFFKLSQKADLNLYINGYGPVDIINYDNGLSMVCLQIRYGSNNEIKKENTKKLYRDLYNFLGKERLEFKVVTMNENFTQSKECESYIRKLNKSEYKDLGLKLLSESLKISEDSNVITNYIIIKTNKKDQLFSFENALPHIYESLMGNGSFRSVEFLTYEEFKNFAEKYYGLEVIDLSRVKDINLDEVNIESFNDIVSVYVEKDRVENILGESGRRLESKL